LAEGRPEGWPFSLGIGETKGAEAVETPDHSDLRRPGHRVREEIALRLFRAALIRNDKPRYGGFHDDFEAQAFRLGLGLNGGAAMQVALRLVELHMSLLLQRTA